MHKVLCKVLETPLASAPAAFFRRFFRRLIRTSCEFSRSLHFPVLRCLPLALAAAWVGAPGVAAAPEPPRLIVISWDGAADWVVDRLLEDGRLPHLARLRARGAGAEHMLPTFPSKTAVSHAALWTGCWPGCTGITGNHVLVEPRSRNTLLDTTSGFSSEALTAEPLYVTAAKAGRKVVVLSATHSHPALPHLQNLRAAGVPTRHLVTFSGFDQRIADGALIDAGALRQAGPRQAGPRQAGLPPHGGPVFELSTTVGETPFEVLVFDHPDDPVEGLDTVWIRPAGKSRPAAVLKPRPANRAAEGWSPPLEARRGDLEGNTFFRLFELAPDGSRMALYQRAASALRGAHSRRQRRAYVAAYPGFHDDAFWRYGRGNLGPSLAAGGDGTTERRLLEIVAHDVELLKRGTRFALARWRPDLLWHYSPMTDSAGHVWMGALDPASPAHDPELAAKLWPFYAEVFELLDDWLGDVVRHAPPETIVALVTDHGMAGTAHDLHVNVLLEQAGLLGRRDGGIDLAATRILASDSAFLLRVNDLGFPGGVVAPAERAAVLEAAARALLAARDPDTGGELVPRVWRPEEFAELGLAGPRQGDLYLDPAPGYYLETSLADRAVTRQGPAGEGHHGFWPERRQMHGIFYLAGPGVPPGTTLPSVRQIDVAPTLARLLGIPAPPQSVGRVVLELPPEPGGSAASRDRVPPGALR